ncbi:hypothetical protein Milano_065 [Agrobacterium phage Milano]|nr:hypothetical protein Milano_065 [Agrobacterium phage Milano]
MAFSFVALSSFAENSLSPTQSRWARERAENCLWALGIEEFKTERRTYFARELVTKTINLESTKRIGK